MITTTYADEHMPFGDSLHLPHFQKFMKRLRKRIAPQRVSFYHCGEYGDLYGRPHYHALLFGYAFPDRHSRGKRNGFPIWGSQTLEKLWPYGRSEITDITFESAAYVARYVLKKITGMRAEEHYHGRDPEYVTMSRNPAIGKRWLDANAAEVFPSDSIIARGIPMKPPRYYDRVWELADNAEDATIFDKIRQQRRIRAEQNKDKHTMKHRHDAGIIAKTKANLKRREIDE